MAYQPNIGQAFPLESLGSDIARNSFNYQSILSGLVDWNSTTSDSVIIRLAKDSYPWYEDFVIPSKRQISSSNDTISTTNGKVDSNCFAINSILNQSVYGGDSLSSDLGDVVTLRVTVFNNGQTSWDMYYAPTIHTWKSGMNVRIGNFYQYNNKIYVAMNSYESTITPDADVLLFKPYTTVWTYNDSYKANDLVEYDNNVYRAVADIDHSIIVPSDAFSKFDKVISGYDSTVTYPSGSYVFNDGLFYLSKKESTGIPVVNTSVWESIILIRNTTYTSISKSIAYRMFTNIDISSFILFNAGSDSSTLTNITVQPSIKTIGNPSIYQRSTGVHHSVNYSNYPLDKSPIWSESAPIDYTDDSIDITKKQRYSATMVFDHTNQKDCNTINFINYDGPDLDQGLCIYLPIECELSSNEIVEPEDGYTFEFYFRIWPNEKLTNAITRDHIVNKAQIYVYSALNNSAIAQDKCSYPIAKFSMSRMTNFHIFAENITIPDKPVVYRATFIYSKNQHDWLLSDYYQMPDHVFVGPIGFIDPANPSAIDRYLGDINKDVVNVGYETSALPTYVDVFSRPDLQPYKSSDGKFYKRSI